VKAAAHITRRRLLYGLIAVVTVLAVLSVVLPYVGSGSDGITKLFP
jgi:hypothetical protein